MTLVPNPIIAKQDRPGYGAVGPCKSGKFAQRWVVIYATDIALCELLDFDGGVLVKFTELYRNPGTFFLLQYRWTRTLPGTTITCRLQRSPAAFLGQWFCYIDQPPKRIFFNSSQPTTTQLKQADFTDSPGIVGTWDVMPPVGGLGWQMFKTESDALSVWPDALGWDW